MDTRQLAAFCAVVERRSFSQAAERLGVTQPAVSLQVRALEKRPEDRYQSAEDMRHDLEEFLEESGLKSGNRRMALYMQEVFAPDAATTDAGVEKARAFGDGRTGGSSRRPRGGRVMMAGTGLVGATL